MEFHLDDLDPPNETVVPKNRPLAPVQFIEPKSTTTPPQDGAPATTRMETRDPLSFDDQGNKQAHHDFHLGEIYKEVAATMGGIDPVAQATGGESNYGVVLDTAANPINYLWANATGAPYRNPTGYTDEVAEINSHTPEWVQRAGEFAMGGAPNGLGGHSLEAGPRRNTAPLPDMLRDVQPLPGLREPTTSQHTDVVPRETTRQQGQVAQQQQSSGRPPIPDAAREIQERQRADANRRNPSPKQFSLDDLEEPRMETPSQQQQALKVYHGSPHDFDKFDISKLGTGEGAQAYGHGLYFAEKEDVAKSYRDAASPNTITLGGTPIPKESPLYEALINNTGEKAGDLRAYFEKNLPYHPDWQPIVDELKGHPDDAVVGRGRIYEANLDVEHHDLLDWDKPISEQPPKVRDAIKTALDTTKYSGPEPSDSMTGAQAYQWLSSQVGPENISAKLNELGVPGLRFLDQGSRDDGDGTRNFVMFDDKKIRVTAKDGQQFHLDDLETEHPTQQQQAFVGPKGGADVERLIKLAQDMEHRGATPEEIWKNTTDISRSAGSELVGAFKDTDGHWKVELHDGRLAASDGVAEFPHLAERYPGMVKEATVRAGPQVKSGSGGYHFDDKTLYVDVPKEEDAKGVLSHELGHGIQGEENWPFGSSVDFELREKLIDFLHEHGRAPTREEQLKLQLGALDSYEKGSGEFAARHQQSRADMSWEERAANPPTRKGSLSEFPEDLYTSRTAPELQEAIKGQRGRLEGAIDEATSKVRAASEAYDRV